MIDFTPACQRTAQLLKNVSDDQLTAARPCALVALSGRDPAWPSR
jgi:hypothetical protein